MTFGVNSVIAANLLEAQRTSPQAGPASDSFSQQLLTMLQSSLDRLGVGSASVQLVPADARSSSPRQFLVTIAGTKASAAPSEPPPFEMMYENHPGFNPRLFASREMANWLAERLGGEVGTFQWQWSPEVQQPPAGYTVRFGDKEINAGCLALYFEQGRFMGSDREAALALFRDGVVNDYVRQHRPELIEEFGLPA